LQILETARSAGRASLMRHPILLTTAKPNDWCPLRDNSVLGRVTFASKSRGRSVFLEALIEELTFAHLVITDVQDFDSIALAFEGRSPSSL
jgi:hypothetical protein